MCTEGASGAGPMVSKYRISTDDVNYSPAKVQLSDRSYIYYYISLVAISCKNILWAPRAPAACEKWGHPRETHETTWVYEEINLIVSKKKKKKKRKRKKRKKERKKEKKQNYCWGRAHLCRLRAFVPSTSAPSRSLGLSLRGWSSLVRQSQGETKLRHNPIYQSGPAAAVHSVGVGSNPTVVTLVCFFFTFIFSFSLFSLLLLPLPFPLASSLSLSDFLVCHSFSCSPSYSLSFFVPSVLYLHPK